MQKFTHNGYKGVYRNTIIEMTKSTLANKEKQLWCVYVTIQTQSKLMQATKINPENIVQMMAIKTKDKDHMS